MAINPLLVSIKNPQDLVTAIPDGVDHFLYYDSVTKKMQKAPMSDIYNKVNGSFSGTLMISDTATPTESTWYFAGESGTYTNAGGLIVDISGKLVILYYDGSTWNKVEIAMPDNPAKAPQWVAGTYTAGAIAYDLGVTYRVKDSSPTTTERPSETATTWEQVGVVKVATTTTNGLMSSEDKSKVENIKNSDEVAFAVTDGIGNAVILTENNGETSLIQKVQNLVTNLKKVGFDFNSANEVVLPEFDTEGIESQIDEINVKLEDVQILDDVPFAVTDKSGNAVILTDETGETSLIQKLENLRFNLAKVGFTFDANGNVNVGGSSDIIDFFDAGFGFSDGEGNLIAKITSEGFETIKIKAEGIETTKIKADEYDLPIQPNNWLYKKSIWSLGDSLAEGGVWQKKIADLNGAIWNDSLKNLTNQGGTKTIDGNFRDRSGNTRAKNLKKLRDAGQKVDVIMIECTNDGGTRNGSFQEEPYFENQILVNDTNIAPSYSTVDAWVSANINTLLANARLMDYNIITKAWDYGNAGSFQPMAHTILYFKAYKSDLATKSLKITSPSTASGTITITGSWGSVGVTVSAGDSIETITTKILAYDFRYHNDELVNENDLSQGIIFTNDNGSSFTLSVNYGTTGVTGILTDGTGGNMRMRYVYKSLNTANWNNANYWVNRDTAYQPEYGTESGKYGVSLYQGNKGLIEYLQRNFPEATIIWMLPTSVRFPFSDLESAKTDPTWSQYFYPSGDFNYYAYWSNFATTWYELEAVAEDVCKKYACRFVSMKQASGITLINGATYYNNNDVHPKTIAYERWGETISRELFYN